MITEQQEKCPCPLEGMNHIDEGKTLVCSRCGREWDAAVYKRKKKVKKP